MTQRIILAVVLAAAFFAAPSPTSQPSPTPMPGGHMVLLVANKAAHALGIIDPDSGRQIATVPESGITGHEVVASPDGQYAFVPIYGNSGVGSPGTDGSTMDVVDLVTRRTIQTVDFGSGVRPHCAVIGPKDGLLYVTTELKQSVTIIDPRTFKIVGEIPTGQPESHMLAISPDGTRGYTANVGPGTVSVLDIANRKTLNVIKVANHVQRISVSADGKWVFTSDTEKPRLAVISTATNKVERWIDLPGQGYGSAVSPDGTMLVIAIPSKNSVAVVDVKTMKVERSVEVAANPQEVLIRPDGLVAYVSCINTGQVAAVNISEYGDKSVKIFDAGKGADGLAWAK
jgi:DNA-binding beta-propeller fold protein YncE